MSVANDYGTSCIQSEGTEESASYCLDVAVGYLESHTEQLIGFLEQTGAGTLFEIQTVQRGTWSDGVKVVRIKTTRGRELMRAIAKDPWSGDQITFELHASFEDAHRSDMWSPDSTTRYGSEPFTL